MSGRLVILPHKSWHVWNQDNREKVLRDERIHREQEAERQKKAQSVEREHNYEALKGQAGDETGTKVQEPERFCLFDAPKIHDDLQHPDFVREQEEKEKRKRKRDGVDNWALGKGDFESNSRKLWYNSVTQGDPAGPARSRGQLDPMRKFLPRPAPEPSRAAAPPVQNEVRDSQQPDEVERKTKNSKHKRSKDAKEARREKKSRGHRSGDRSNCSSDGSSDGSEVIEDPMLAQLREKRLQRERAERKKEAQLLAQSDVFGDVSQPRGYHSQYHPQLSRRR